PELEKLTKQIKETKEKIEILEKEKYGKVVIELAKQLESINAEEEGTSEELFVEVVSEIGSDEEIPEANVLPAPPVYAKAGGQNVENITNPEKFAKKYLVHMVPTLDKEVALMTTDLINRIYDEAGIEIETIRYYELQFHVLQANFPEKLWNILELQLAEWTMTRPPWKAYEAAVWACACLFMKLSRLGRIPQNFAG
uniref:Uncharacterized protein n=1 Tax=Romanomermis culicivorax TaxID=13658 RepID=A0A915KA46_ROMCU